MTASTASTTSSGYSSQASGSVNPRYACYWLDSCRGQHELDACSHWRVELRAKNGIYYSPSGLYKCFTTDHINGLNLMNNPTGYTTVYLLIYTIRAQNKIEILFVSKLYKDEHDETKRLPLLFLPSTKPHKRSEPGEAIAFRAFEWITHRADIGSQGLKTRFLFQHGAVIYPLYLTNEHADTVTQNFQPNEKLLSLHWFSLTDVLAQLPPWNNYLISEATSTELAQHRHIHPVGIQLGSHELWKGTATCLMCIREHIPGGFEEFLKV